MQTITSSGKLEILSSASVSFTSSESLQLFDVDPITSIEKQIKQNERPSLGDKNDVAKFTYGQIANAARRVIVLSVSHHL